MQTPKDFFNTGLLEKSRKIASRKVIKNIFLRKGYHWETHLKRQAISEILKLIFGRLIHVKLAMPKSQRYVNLNSLTDQKTSSFLRFEKCLFPIIYPFFHLSKENKQFKETIKHKYLIHT